MDLEVDPKTAKVFDLAAVGFGNDKVIRCRNGDMAAALDEMEEALTDTDHVIGHNILRHDLPHLAAARPRFAGLARAPIDTLWLNPLAFPRNPYHRLVKHYYDGRLQSGHVNDPEADAGLVFEVLENQLDAFRKMAGGQGDLLAAYHFLTTRGEGDGGFDAVFRAVRGATVASSCASPPRAGPR